jgi:hypothetical protein
VETGPTGAGDGGASAPEATAAQPVGSEQDA